MSEEFAPEQLPDKLESKFLMKIRSVDSVEEANWLTTLASSLTDWNWPNARYQAGVIKSKYGHLDLLQAIDKHYSDWLKKEEDE